MSVSIEALAMARADCIEWGLDIDEWERDDEPPPPHLLADGEEEEGEEFVKGHVKQDCCINNSSLPRYHCRERVTELHSATVVQRRSTIENIWFYLMSIEKMVRTMIKLLMISCMERRVNNR
ncbi:hypothetical protein QQP08_002363 [Theobroma cacao]|nr:hypothetical protein QQP08_002363 [Theobroma cacao]